jgi:hypothetical protein
MSIFATAFALLWVLLLLAAPIACAYGLIQIPPSSNRGRSARIAILGLLISALFLISLATTVLLPLALIVVPALLLFAYAIFRPSIFARRVVRSYLVSCLAVGELFWIWMFWFSYVQSK